MKKKLFCMMLLVASLASGVWAQNTVVVYQKNGQTAKFGFTEKPVVTYSDNELVLTTNSMVVSYPIYQLRKIELDVDDIITAVKEMKPAPASQMQFALADGKLIANGGEAGSVLTLYNINGVMVGLYRFDSQGCVTIPTDNLSEGIYIVKTKQLSFKFRKS